MPKEEGKSLSIDRPNRQIKEEKNGHKFRVEHSQRHKEGPLLTLESQTASEREQPVVEWALGGSEICSPMSNSASDCPWRFSPLKLAMSYAELLGSNSIESDHF